jgi:hypothetical protein
MRFVALITTFTGALIFTAAAEAVPPTLSSVGHQDRHPTAVFTAPKSDHVVITIASKPDRATSGDFLSENEQVFDVMTDSEIQTGRWLYNSQLDPGTYYVLLRASPDFDLCYMSDGSYDPSCADGYSDMATLTIPKPSTSYAAQVRRDAYLERVELRLVAAPLGEKTAYRVCYFTAKKRKQCLTGTLSGYSWNSAADDSLTAKTRNLSTFTTFTWLVGGKAVATKRARVR